ncbi:hypothetical protein L596_021216 [Steinernema carpocapsae]|uniref:Uncharacterized protein n=1 Tax=Steinernema carpocapsae TaxID=34508 RepID=A0A4U5MVX0_STECR|nr:hypothetical protein L596_021216 [Steinernema carpocapsae]
MVLHKHKGSVTFCVPFTKNDCSGRKRFVPVVIGGIFFLGAITGIGLGGWALVEVCNVKIEIEALQTKARPARLTSKPPPAKSPKNTRSTTRKREAEEDANYLLTHNVPTNKFQCQLTMNQTMLVDGKLLQKAPWLEIRITSNAGDHKKQPT